MGQFKTWEEWLEHEREWREAAKLDVNTKPTGFLRWTDPNGKNWSVDKNDRVYYDVDKKAYCVNLDKPGVLEINGVQQSDGSVFVKLGDAIKNSTDPDIIDRVILGVDQAVRRYYGRTK